MATYHIEWQAEDMNAKYYGSFGITVGDYEYVGDDLQSYLREQVIEEVEEQIGRDCNYEHIRWQPYRL